VLKIFTMCVSFVFVFIIFPVFPTTTQLSGMFLIITDPAPMIHHLPILTPGITVAFEPICVPSPIETLPVIVALGEI